MAVFFLQIDLPLAGKILFLHQVLLALFLFPKGPEGMLRFQSLLHNLACLGCTLCECIDLFALRYQGQEMEWQKLFFLCLSCQPVFAVYQDIVLLLALYCSPQPTKIIVVKFSYII